jgi:LPPG:FO 2-phospho-L-lactate transferase
MILALAGGVGGARLANGLAKLLPPGELTIAVNTGDDFIHLGLPICPDIDTMIYTLAGRNNRELGWGIEGESWAFMDALKALGGPGWFNLGDRDIATHVWRAERMRQGRSLSEITAELAVKNGITQHIVPMSDNPVRSFVMTDEGELAFQDYFVRRRCEPRFQGIRFDGAESAKIAPAFAAAFGDPTLTAIIICPSNPLLSIGPFFAISSIRDELMQRKVPCIAVSPFIGGEAVKGPAAKIMRELGEKPGVDSLAKQYAGIVDAILCDDDHSAAGQTINGIVIHATDTLMRDDAGQLRLAREALGLAHDLACRL